MSTSKNSIAVNRERRLTEELARTLLECSRKAGLSQESRCILQAAAECCLEECARDQDKAFQLWLHQLQDVASWPVPSKDLLNERREVMRLKRAARRAGGQS